ncbi:MAG: YlzJ-like family protein [Firmicutes bacterium]|nr:YlzJ-like family protein [Alicyclobacillaceae bacterium]MCL6496832.1 YlzJ-like family protein [Bacillota bacterium]
MLYTPMPWEMIFPEPVEAQDQLWVSVRGRLCQVRRGPDGWPRIERLVSTDPQDYLEPALNPHQALFTL